LPKLVIDFYEFGAVLLAVAKLQARIYKFKLMV
jgi:hypothetical protein